MLIVSGDRNATEVDILNAAIHWGMEYDGFTNNLNSTHGILTFTNVDSRIHNINISDAVVFLYEKSFPEQKVRDFFDNFCKNKFLIFYNLDSKIPKIELMKLITFNNIRSIYFTANEIFYSKNIFNYFKDVFHEIIKIKNPNGCCNFVCKSCGNSFKSFKKISFIICDRCLGRSVKEVS